MHKLVFWLSLPILLATQGHVFAAPPMPTAIAPATGSTVNASDSITFEWGVVAGASSYDLIVIEIKDSGFVFRDQNVSSDVCDATTCSQTVVDSQLNSSSSFVWRVAAIDDTGRSSFSHSRYDVLQPAPPTVPVPVSPAQGTNVVVGQAVTFIWQVSAQASAYDFYLYDRVSGSVTYRDRNIFNETFCDANQCNYTISDTQLPVSPNHVWRVSGRNNQGLSGFSHTRFNVIADGPPPIPQTLAPTLNQELPDDVPLSFSWNESETATTYDLYLWDRTSRTVTFRNTRIPVSVCTDGICTFSSTDAQLPIGDYVWRLAAKGSGGRSSFTHTAFSVIDSDLVPPPPFPFLNDYELVFSDEFQGSQLDSNKWHTALLWGPYQIINNEQQMYVDAGHMHADFSWSPFELTGETLKISAEPTSDSLQAPERPAPDSELWNKPFTEYRQNPDLDVSEIEYLSGIITSYESFKMTHGYVETRAKLPPGQGLWPAFWMLPTHYVNTVPEIDVMEFLGNNVSRVYNTYHYFDVPAGWQLISTPSFPVDATDWTQKFHTFGMEWSPRRIRWYIDGQMTHEITDAEFDIPEQAMYLLANLAVGGNWPGEADATTPFPATYELDYIRAYKRKMPETLDLSKYQIMFEDDFSGTTLDADKWNTHFLWGPYLRINNEEQYYVDTLGSDADIGYTPFTIADGKLTITARAADDPDGIAPPAALPAADDSIWTDFPSFQRDLTYTQPTYTSGIITSYDAFKFANGYAEIRAKIPKGDGLWPAFWLLNAYYVGREPEIDILEVRGELPNQIVHTYHRRNLDGLMVASSYVTDNQEPVDGYADDFHDYGVRWERGKITWYIDGTPVQTYTGDDVAYQIMYVLLNLAVGGDFNFSATDPSAIPAEFVIDHVRVWQEKELP